MKNLSSPFAFLWASLPAALWISVLMITARPVAAQELAVIVHPEVPVKTLSHDTLQDIFYYKKRTWDDGSPIWVAHQKPDTTAYEVFVREILHRSPESFESYRQRLIFSGRIHPAQQLTRAEILEFVRTTPGAIGYVVVSDMADLDGVRPVAGLRDLEDEDLEELLADTPEASAVAIDPLRPEHLYVSFASNGLYRSTDGGESWRPAGAGLEGLNITAIVVDPVDSATVYAGDENGVYRSNDNGVSFARLPDSPPNVTDLKFPPFDSQTLFVVTRNGVWSTSDQGLRFSDRLPRLDSDLSEMLTPCCSLAFSKNGEGIFLSVLNQVFLASEWRFMPTGRFSGRIRDMDTDLRGGLWIATNTGVHRSNDRGASWEPTTFSEAVRQIEVTSNAIFVLNEKGLYRTYNGVGWVLLESRSSEALTIDPNYMDRLFLSANGEVFRSLDRGGQWRGVIVIAVKRQETFEGKRRPPPPPPPIPIHLNGNPVGHHVAALTLDNAGNVWAGAEHGIWRSSDKGRNWIFAGDGLALTDVHALAAHPRDVDVLYAGTHGAGVYKTTNSGGFWEPTGLTQGQVRTLAIDPFSPERLYAATAEGVLLSVDGGASWTYLEPYFKATGLAFSEGAALGVHATGIWGKLLQTNTSARTIRSLGDRYVEANPAQMQRGCADAAAVLPHGVDDCLEFLNIRPNGLRPRDLLFSQRGGEERAIAPTVVGLWERGKDGYWRPLPNGMNVADVAVAFDGGLYAAATDGLWYLPPFTDRVARWRPTPDLQEAVFSVAVGDDEETIYAGLANGRVAMRRFEKGAWTTQIEELPSPQPVAYLGPLQENGEEAPRRTFRFLTPERPKQIPPAMFQAWFNYLETPADRLRLRSLVAAELMSWAAGDYADILHQDLVRNLSALGADASSVNGLSVSPDDRWLAAGYLFDDGIFAHSELRLFDQPWVRWRQLQGPEDMAEDHPYWRELHDLSQKPRNLLPSWILPDPGPLLAWSPDSQHLATHSDLSEIRVWAMSGAGNVARTPGSSVFELPDATGAIDAVFLAVGGRRLAYATSEGNDTVVRVLRRRLDTKTGEGFTDVRTVRVPGLPGDPAPKMRHVLLTPGGHWLIAFDLKGVARAWDLRRKAEAKEKTDGEDEEAPEPFASTYDEEPWTNVRLSSNGRWLTAQTPDKDLHLWQVRGDNGPQLMAGWAHSVVATRTAAATFRRDGRFLLFQAGGQVELWDLKEADNVRNVVTVPQGGPAFFDGTGLVVRDGSVIRHWDLSEEPYNASLYSGVAPSFMTQAALPIQQRWKAPRFRVSSHEQRWSFQAEGIDLRILDAADTSGGGLLARIGRLGPMGAHPDEASMSQASLDALAQRPSTATLREMSPPGIATVACEIIGRSLTEAEWERYFGDQPYAPVCIPPPAEP